MDFELTEEQKAIQQSVREFAVEELKPIIMEYDEAKKFPEHLIPKLGELGLLGVIFPEEYGGAGMGYIEYSLILEELSAIDPSIGLTVSAHNSLGTNHIFQFGNDAQKRKYIPPLASGKTLAAWALTEPGSGSDAGALKTTAVKKGNQWILNGQKTFITNPNYSDYAVIMARTNPEKGKKGISAFVVEKGTPGYTIGSPMNKLGTRASDTAELFFEDCAIPEENLLGEEGTGFKQAMQILTGGRIGIAAMCLGIARGAYDYTIRYSREREAFGQPISEFQAVQFRLADMATEIEAARLLTFRAAWQADQGMDFSLAASMAKLYSSELAVRVSDAAVQTYGGYGFIKEYPVEKFFRDSKIGTIGEGTSDIQRLVIARELIKQLEG